jgi:hypothetical protein
MVNGLKRAIAGVSTGLILAGSIMIAPLASAQTFSDVPTTHWAYSYVEDGVAKGFFDAGTNFYPDRNLNRAELAKLVFKVAKYANIVTDIDTTNAPSFTDVPKDAWFYPYVATVTKANLMSGYKDANGNPTGKFGPADMVTRAQAAKSFINAAGVANATTPAAPFSDLVAGSWYMDYISTAYNKSVIDGYANGKFGPNDPVTRAQIAKIISNSLNPKDRPVANTNVNGVVNGNVNGVVNGNANVPVIPKAGTLDVSLSNNTPAAEIIPYNATAAKYLTVKLTAGAGNDISLNTLTVYRTGLGSKDDFDKVWAEYAGTRISSRQTVGTDDSVVMTFNPVFVVKAGTTVELDVVAEMAAAGGGYYDAFSLKSANDVLSSAATVTGSFPINGNTMQTSAYGVTVVQLHNVSSGTLYKVGDINQELGKFEVTNTSSSKDVLFKQVTLKNSGTAVWTDFANLALYESGAKVSTSFTTSDKYITFNLGAGSTIGYGDSKTYSIRGDIVDVNNTPNDTLQLSIRYQEDFLATEVTTGFGAAVLNTDALGSTSFVNFDLGTYTLQGGKITISRDPSSPATQSVPQSTNDVTFLVAKMNVQQPFTADGVNLYLCANIPASNIPSGKTAEYVIGNDIDNLRIYNGSSIIQSKSLEASDLGATGFTGCPTSTGWTAYTLNFDSSVSFTGDTLLTVKGNFTSGAKLGDRYAFVLDLSDTQKEYMFRNQTPEYTNGNAVHIADPNVTTDVSDVIGQAAGNIATVQGSTITVARNDGYTDGKSLIPGSTTSLAKWTLTANDAANLSLKEFKAKKLSPEPTTGQLTDSYITGCDLYAGGTKIGTQNVAGGVVDFTGLNTPIAANASLSVELKCSISTGALAGETLGFQVDNSSLDVEDANSNWAIVSGTPTPAYFTVVGTGILTVAQDSGRPNAGYLVANTTADPVAKFKLSATDDAIQITDFYLANVAGGTVTDQADGRVAQYTLTWTGGSVTATSVNGIIHFALGNNSTLIVPKDGNVVVTVAADLNEITKASDTGKLVLLSTTPGFVNDTTLTAGTVNGVRAISYSTGSELTGITVSGTSNLFAITKTRPTFAVTGSDGTLIASSGKEIYRFTVAANAGADVELAQIPLKITTSGQTDNGVKLSNIYMVEDGTSNHLNGTEPSVLEGSATVVPLRLDQPTRAVIPAGQSKTYVVYADISDTAQTGTSSLSVQIANEAMGIYETKDVSTLISDGASLIWSDNADPALTETSQDWANGLLNNELPLTPVRSYTINH